MRLVDADAYSAEMKDRQEAAWKWRNEAIAQEDEVKLERAEGAYTAFTEAKLTMDKHIINPWHRVEDELPKYGQDVLAARLYGADSDGWAYEVIIAHVCEVRGTNYWNATNVTHWMPLPEPPKEDA